MANVKTSNKKAKMQHHESSLEVVAKVRERSQRKNLQTKSLLGLWTESRTGSELRFIGLTHKDSLKII